FLTQHATHWFPIFDRYRIYACPLLIRCLLAAFFLQLFHLLLRHLSTLDNWGSPTVTDRECQSIGSIRRLRRFTQSEDTGNHSGHLLLISTTIARDSLFHFRRSVHINRYIALGCSQHQHANTMGCVQHRGDIAALKKSFNRDHVWLVIIHPFLHRIGKTKQALCQNFLWWGARNTHRDGDDCATAASLYYGKTTAGYARVNTYDAQTLKVHWLYRPFAADFIGSISLSMR